MNPIKKNDTTKEVVVDKKEDVKEDILKEAINKVTEVEKEVDYTVIVQSLNVRESASTSSKSVGIVRSGDILVVKEDSYTQSGWKKVVKPISGYVKSEFVAKKKG